MLVFASRLSRFSVDVDRQWVLKKSRREQAEIQHKHVRRKHLPMLCLIPILAGLLIMMGQHDRSEALFYYFRLEDQVPETHLLRLIEKHISFAFVREKLKGSYSGTGRPSIDPELLLRILLIGYLYGITSERNLVEEPGHEQDQVSTTDPDSTYATKGGTPARLGYYDNYLVDNHSCVIVGVQATAARMSQETVAAQDMLTRFTQWQAREPESVAADTTYGNGEFLQWLADRSITPYMRTRDNIHRKRSPFFGPERFTYEPENNRYICPAGQFLNYGGRVYRNRAFNYIGTRKKCGPCSLRPQCTSAAFRGLIIHQNEPARQRARELVNTLEFANAQRQRKKVEALFAELKNQIGLRRLRLRRMKFVREQFFLAAAAQNIKRLVRFLSQMPRPPLAATT